MAFASTRGTCLESHHNKRDCNHGKDERLLIPQGHQATRPRHCLIFLPRVAVCGSDAFPSFRDGRSGGARLLSEALVCAPACVHERVCVCARGVRVRASVCTRSGSRERCFRTPQLPAMTAEQVPSNDTMRTRMQIRWDEGHSLMLLGPLDCKVYLGTQDSGILEEQTPKACMATGKIHWYSSKLNRRDRIKNILNT